MISRYATIIFFLAFGIGFFVAGSLLNVVAAVAAIVVAIAILAGN